MKKEIYYQGYFYDVTNWIEIHPGGNIIKFYTEKGENATDAFEQFHFRSKKAHSILKSLKKRPAEIGEFDENISNKLLTEDFKKLQNELINEGMFDPSLTHIIYRISELVFMYLVGMYLFFNGFWKSAIFILGIFQGRGGWLMHEMGHYSFTGNLKKDRFLQAIIMGCVGGLSAAWWRSLHNRHHAMPQRFERDVDLKTLPFLAFNSILIKDRKDADNFFTRNQAILFLTIDSFIVFFIWRAWTCPKHSWKKGNYFELLFMVLHYSILFLPLGFGPYALSGFIGGIYMFGNFSLSHTHLDVTEEPKHWVEYALTHTANIKPNFIVSWWMGYLNYQIEHHLFPAMPQFRHHLISERVKKLAETHGLKYHSFSYFYAVKKTLKNLWDVSNEIKQIHSVKSHAN